MHLAPAVVSSHRVFLGDPSRPVMTVPGVTYVLPSPRHHSRHVPAHDGSMNHRRYSPRRAVPLAGYEYRTDRMKARTAAGYVSLFQF